MHVLWWRWWCWNRYPLLCVSELVWKHQWDPFFDLWEGHLTPAVFPYCMEWDRYGVVWWW